MSTQIDHHQFTIVINSKTGQTDEVSRRERLNKTITF